MAQGLNASPKLSGLVTVGVLDDPPCAFEENKGINLNVSCSLMGLKNVDIVSISAWTVEARAIISQTTLSRTTLAGVV